MGPPIQIPMFSLQKSCLQWTAPEKPTCALLNTSSNDMKSLITDSQDSDSFL